MNIKHITIENFRGFAFREFDFDPQMNVIVGNNTARKTSLLHALQIALGAYFQALPLLPKEKPYRRNFGKNDDRKEYSKVNDDWMLAGKARLEVTASFSIPWKNDLLFPNPIHWVRESNVVSKKTAGELMDVVEEMARIRLYSDKIGENVTLPLFLTFGAKRVEDNYNKAQKTIVRESNIAKAYKYALHESVDFTSAFDWLYKAGNSLKNESKQSDVNLDALLEMAKESEKEDAETANLYNNIAGVCKAQGDYFKAWECYQKALEIQVKILGSDHPDTATTYNNLADVYNAQGDYFKAWECYQKALEIQVKILGSDHPDTATTYNNLADVYNAQGDYFKAWECYQKALEIREKVLGKEHPDTATTYNGMANVYRSQGDYVRALKFYQNALEIKERVFGKDHPSTATTYNNIAGVYEDQGKYDEALGFYRKALRIREKVLGKEHPDTATTYNNIAGVYKAQCNYDEALEFIRKALEISEKVLGKEHPSTATTYNNIAVVYEAQGKYDEALESYRKALEIIEKVLGKEHPSTATTYNNIAVVYQAMGNYDEALEFYRKALEIVEKVLGKEHPSTATTYNNIAVVYYAQGKYDEALESCRKALEIFEKVLGKEHPSTATTYNNIAGVYRAQGKYDEALEFYRKALEIVEKVLGREHPDTATTYNNIAGVFRALGENDKASEYRQKALEIRGNALDKDHLYNLSDEKTDLLEVQNKYEKPLENVEVCGGDAPVVNQSYQVRIAFFDAIKDAIPAIKELKVNTKNNELEAIVQMTDKEPEYLTYDMMSDGFKAIIGIVSEMAYRCIMLNGYLGAKAIRETPGVVLIDEVDLYLHPHWQRHILKDLCKAFPKIQFFVTTHSPFIIQSVDSRNVIALDGTKMTKSPSDRGIEEIAAAEMGLEGNLRSEIYRRKFELAEKYFQLVKKGEEDRTTIETVKKELDDLELEAHLLNDPAYEAFLKLNRGSL